MAPHNFNILPRDGEAYFFKNFFTEEESLVLFDMLMKTIKFEQQQIKIFGKLIDMPRLTAWYGDEGSVYSYSNLENNPLPWTKELLLIKERIETIAEVKFNSVLLNLYRTGSDSMGWHKDDEKELGMNPTIGSVSFGATREFKFKHDSIKRFKVGIQLMNGSFLLMKGSTQHHWYHAIAKTTEKVLPRINLTFRRISDFGFLISDFG